MLRKTQILIRSLQGLTLSLEPLQNFDSAACDLELNSKVDWVSYRTNASLRQLDGQRPGTLTELDKQRGNVINSVFASTLKAVRKPA